jgi:hypothetical protein
MIIDLEFPHLLPQLKGRAPRVPNVLRFRTRGTRPSIGGDTPLVPRAAAEAVWEEACELVGEELPREWIAMLIEKAEVIYGRSTRYRRWLRGSDRSGRDWLWAFMRHWLAALLSEHRPAWYARLPTRYAVGNPDTTARV